MPSLDFETKIFEETGLRRIAGLDEAGRGALAGPVVAAAVILPLNRPDKLAVLREVNDSKQLSARVRARLFPLIVDTAVAHGVGIVPPEVIDRTGILPATRQAMRQALTQLESQAEFLLIDGRLRLKTINLPQQSLVRGDGKSLSIAAASILAKVTRDRLMVALDGAFPQYGFARHKGYGTPQHLAAIAKHGPSPHHRLSFAPMRQTLV